MMFLNNWRWRGSLYSRLQISVSGAPITLLRDARLYFFHDGTGVAMMDDYWAGKIHYFAFGCDHKYRQVYGEEATKLGLRPIGLCETAHYCDKCGDKMVVDSSD